MHAHPKITQITINERIEIIKFKAVINCQKWSDFNGIFVYMILSQNIVVQIKIIHIKSKTVTTEYDIHRHYKVYGIQLKCTFDNGF